MGERRSPCTETPAVDGDEKAHDHEIHRANNVTPNGKQAWSQCQAIAERSFLLLCLFAILAFPAKPAYAADPQEAIERVKLSVVGIGTFLKSRSPEVNVTGVGFVVADGRYVVTAASSVGKPLDVGQKEILVTIVSGQPQPREARLLSVDKEHDLALLRISGDPLPALRLGDSGRVREGQMLMFTGFSPSTALGLYPATLRSMVSAILPAMLTGPVSQQLPANEISRIRESRYVMFQLDAKAYPGNRQPAV